MYAIHTTPGFIIDARPYGEADKLLSIFTRDLGLVTAVAQGIRLERSKLRYFAGDRAFGTYSLVRGREFWRLTSAQNGEASRPASKPARELVARLALLLRRFLQGEEPHPELYAAVHSCASFLGREDAALDAERLKTLESLAVLRIMSALGYVAADPELALFLDDPSAVSIELIDAAGPKRAAMNAHINTALRESHL